MFLHKSPWILKKLYSSALQWNVENTQKELYLTFDDGPIPELTPWVLELLEQFNVKATFFHVGENIKKHPDLFQLTIEKGHKVGNHTYNHFDGWKHDTVNYLNNFSACENILKEQGYSTNLFRPPYGKIRREQAQIIKDQGYNIWMWDVLTGDFSKQISPAVCLQKSIKYTRSGSVIVFHENVKATSNIQYALPKYLEHCLHKGYQFKVLP